MLALSSESCSCDVCSEVGTDMPYISFESQWNVVSKVAHRTALQKWHKLEFIRHQLHSLDSLWQLQPSPCRSLCEDTALFGIHQGVPFTNAYSFVILMANSTEFNDHNVEEAVENFLCHCSQHNSTSAKRKSFVVHKILGLWPPLLLLQKATKVLLWFLEAARLFYCLSHKVQKCYYI